MQGFVRKRVLPVLFPAGAKTCFEPSAVSDKGESQGLLLSRWDGVAAPPEAGAKVVDRAAEDGRLGTLVSVSPGERRREGERSIFLPRVPVPGR